MKLVSFCVRNTTGRETRVGALVEDEVIDLQAAYAARLKSEGATERYMEIARALLPEDMVDFFYGGKLSMQAAEQAIDFAQNQVKTTSPDGADIVYEMDSVTLLAPVPKPASIRDTISFETHAKNFERRTGKPTPDLWYQRPVYYKGNCRTVVGPDAPVEKPAYTDKLDYELEFGAFIGKTGRNIKAADAADYIAGYTIFNDISARDALQNEIAMMLGPAKGKDMDSGNVLGPCLVTPDELDVSNLAMEARINGETWSAGNSSDMYWSFPRIIEFVSENETLYPGDFIGSGTIAFGCGDELDRWIQVGDVVELEVEGIGILRNRIQ